MTEITNNKFNCFRGAFRCWKGLFVKDALSQLKTCTEDGQNVIGCISTVTSSDSAPKCGSSGDDFLWYSDKKCPAAVLEQCFDQKNTEDAHPRYDLSEVARLIHKAADMLPATGVIVNVVLQLPAGGSGFKSLENLELDSLQFLGACRRLKDWHNANITICHPTSSPETDLLQRFLAASIVADLTDPSLWSSCPLWRGKINVCDKIESKGLTIPGMSLTKLCDNTPDLRFPLEQLKVSDRDKTDGVKLGRMLEILDEVELASVPSFMLTSHVYKVCLYQKHPHSQVLMNYIQETAKTGLLARLPVYPSNQPLACCKDTNLSAASWKENIKTDIMFVQEPEEEYQDNYEFLYFILTSPNEDSSVEKFTILAHLLRSPYELNGGMMTILFSPSVPCDEPEDVSWSVEGLPSMTFDLLKRLHKDLEDIQSHLLKDWIVDRKTKGASTCVTHQQLAAFLTTIREHFLQKLKSLIPRFKGPSQKPTLRVTRFGSDLEVNAADWPERLYKAYQESQKRSLSRLQSSESMQMSSPIQPAEGTSTLDIQDFLKYFSQDGSAIAENLSPVRRRQPSRSQTNAVHWDDTSASQMSWPESKELTSHDIYYNKDKKSEKINHHCNRLRDRFVKEETYSSCNSQTVVFPKCIKKKKTETFSPRRSPRKRAPPNLSASLSGSVPLSKRLKGGRLSDSVSPGKKESSRRFSTPQALPSQTSKSATSSGVLDDISQHRAGNSGVRHSSRKNSLQASAAGHIESMESQVQVNSYRKSTGSNSSAVNTPGYLDNKNKRTENRLSESFTERNTPVPKQVEKLRRVSDAGLSISSQSSQSNKESRAARNNRNNKRLQDVVNDVLRNHGVDESNPIFAAASSKLFKVTKVFVMDFTNSRNLRQEMKNIAEAQVKQVIDVETRRQSTDNSMHGKKLPC